MIPISELNDAFATHGQADARFEILRDLLPIKDWPVPLYPDQVITEARIRRSRQKGGIDMQALRPAELIQVMPPEAVQELRELCHQVAQENAMLMRMHKEAFYPYTEESVKRLAERLRKQIQPSSRRGTHEVTVAKLATLAWIAGIGSEEAQSDDEQANALLEHMNLDLLSWDSGGDIDLTAPRL